jgi:hypothetical protein
MADASEQPPLTERIMDGVTDAQFTASQVSDNIQEIGARLREAIQQTRSRSVVTTIEECTRASPLLALGVAFLLGAVLFGPRRR